MRGWRSPVFCPLSPVGINAPIQKADHPLGVLGNVVLVGDHDDGAPFAVQFGQQRHDLRPGFGIQVAGGFIRQDEHRIVDQGAGDGDPLRLPAGEFLRLMVDAVPQADRLQRGDGFLALFGLAEVQVAVVEHGQHHVFDGGGAGQQVVTLEDEPDFAVTDDRQLVLVQIADILPVQEVAPGGRAVEAAQDVHHGALAGAGRPHDGDKFVLLDGQADPVQGTDLCIAHPVDFGQVNGFDDGVHSVFSLGAGNCGVQFTTEIRRARRRCGSPLPDSQSGAIPYPQCRW